MLASTPQCNLRSSTGCLPHGLAQLCAEQKNIQSFRIALLCPPLPSEQQLTPGGSSYFNVLGKPQVPLTFVFKSYDCFPSDNAAGTGLKHISVHG